jgi:acetoin utilization protein AcuB
VIEELDHPDQAESLLDTALSEVMSGDIISIDSGEDLVAACDLILEYRIGAIPVLDRTTSELVGIVSYMDLLRVARDVFAAD